MSGPATPGPVVTPSGFFVLRTPLLPFTEVTAWGGGLQAPAAADDLGLLPDALVTDRAQLRRRLEDIVTTPEFRDALFVASPSLAAAVDVWRKEPDSDKGGAAERSLVSYFLRAAARPTPFGLFAGCTTGIIGERTRMRLDDGARYRRHTRLDMDYLWALAEAVQRDPGLRSELNYRPNSSLYQVGDRLLFAEARRSRSGRSYRLVSVGVTPYLMQTLARARDGARLDTLAAALVEDDVTRADADEYIADLADSQVLVADIRPQLTGAPPTDTLVAALGRHERSASLAHRLAASGHAGPDPGPGARARPGGRHGARSAARPHRGAHGRAAVHRRAGLGGHRGRRRGPRHRPGAAGAVGHPQGRSAAGPGAPRPGCVPDRRLPRRASRPQPHRHDTWRARNPAPAGPVRHRDRRRLFAADVWRVVRRVAARAGLPDDLVGHLGPHTMRQSFATLYLDAGGSLRDLQSAMGHADPRTTRRYDRARRNAYRPPGYVVAAYLADPARQRH